MLLFVLLFVFVFVLRIYLDLVYIISKFCCTIREQK